MATVEIKYVSGSLGDSKIVVDVYVKDVPVLIYLARITFDWNPKILKIENIKCPLHFHSIEIQDESVDFKINVESEPVELSESGFFAQVEFSALEPLSEENLRLKVKGVSLVHNLANPGVYVSSNMTLVFDQ